MVERIDARILAVIAIASHFIEATSGGWLTNFLQAALALEASSVVLLFRATRTDSDALDICLCVLGAVIQYFLLARQCRVAHNRLATKPDTAIPSVPRTMDMGPLFRVFLFSIVTLSIIHTGATATFSTWLFWVGRALFAVSFYLAAVPRPPVRRDRSPFWRPALAGGMS